MKRREQQTISASYDIDEGARLLFEAWLPLKWLKRKLVPDIHVDYRIEVVREGEPTGLNFLVQLKGRSVHKRKARTISEQLETKHLSYYLRCPEPVFVFLIDPMTRQGNWLFIQRYLRERGHLRKLRCQTSLVVRFDAERSLDRLERFERELNGAWAYMRDLFPGSPLAAIRAETQRLEQLDPSCSVRITASKESTRIQVSPRDSMTGGFALKFLKQPGADELQAFYETGQPLQINAADIEAEGSPILSTVIREMGDAKVTINYGGRLSGCVQLGFRSQAAQMLIQFDGDWLIASKRISFKGQLSESPLCVDLACDFDVNSSRVPSAVQFNFQWSAWARQPLLSLAYFNEIAGFVNSDGFVLRAFIRGNQVWTRNFLSPNCEGKGKARDSLEWLNKCRCVAQRAQVNPPFPIPASLHETQSDDVRLMVMLLESGFHEQYIEGQSVTVEGDMPSDGQAPPINHEFSFTLPGQWRSMNFLGVQLPFGPLRYTATDVRLVSITPVGPNRAALTFAGTPRSRWHIEHDTCAG